MGWQHLSEEAKRLRVHRNKQRPAEDAIAQVPCPICKTPLHIAMTAQGPAWRCQCEELKKRRLLPAA